MENVTSSAEGRVPQNPPPKGSGRTARREAGDSGDLSSEDQQDFNDTLKFPPLEGLQGNTTFKSFTPKPPRKPRLERTSSLDELIWRRRRRLRTSQESLTDPAETSSSSGSLQGNPPVCNRLASCGNHLPSQESINSLQRATEPPHMRLGKFSLSDLRDKVSLGNKSRLPQVLPARPAPPLENNSSLPVLKTINRIDVDCADYRPSSRSFFARAGGSWSDTRLHSRGMVCDNCSTASMKSSFSLLTPIRIRDVRNRYVLWTSNNTHSPPLSPPLQQCWIWF